MLGIFFDWQAQSKTIVEGLRVSAEEKPHTRALILDRDHRVIAASDGEGILKETFDLQTGARSMGCYPDGNGRVIGFSLTPGYETYKGLGCYGVVHQSIARTNGSSSPSNNLIEAARPLSQAAPERAATVG